MSEDRKADDTTLPPLPLGWAWAKVDEVGEVKLGRQRSPEHHTGTHMRPYLRVANVYEDRIDLSSVLEMNFTPQEFETYQLRAGDILLNEGQSLELVGRPALYRDELPGACFQNTLVRFRTGPALEPRFALAVFRYYLHSKRFQKLARWTVNIAHLGASRFAEVEFPLPPLAEQRRVVERLDELFSDLDAGVAALVRARANLKKYRAAVLKAAVTGELTEEWRADHPPAEPAHKLLDRILAERRRKWEEEQEAKFSAAGKHPPKDWQDKYPEPAPAIFTGLKPLPEGWCWVSVDTLMANIASGSTAVPQDEPTPVPILRSSSVRPLSVNLDEVRYLSKDSQTAASHALRDGDLLFVRLSGSREYVGACGLVKGLSGRLVVFPDRLFRAVTVEPRVAGFVELCFGSPPIRKSITAKTKSSAGHQRISTDAVSGQAIPLPSLAEQQAIVTEVERQLSIIAATEDYIGASLKRAERLRQSILKEAFAGRLVPQDPKDEPASVLLDRIRQGRPQAVPNGPRTTRKKKNGQHTLFEE